jgi:hypothetical protein
MYLNLVQLAADNFQRANENPLSEGGGIGGLAPGSYTITPSLSGCTFTFVERQNPTLGATV